MKHDLSEKVRDAGYEALFFLGGFLVLSTHHTFRNADKIFDWIGESQSRRELLRRLEKRGLVSAQDDDGDWVPRLTELGQVAFAGGRDPKTAWNRPWDGQWRLLTFDLPRRATVMRSQLRRWLGANRFGRLQGSVWVSPDAIPEITHILSGEQIDPGMVLVFEGGLAGKRRPSEVASAAWDFDKINAAYESYADAACGVLQQIPRKLPSLSRLRSILRRDRELWWAAVQRDPLLPKRAHPRDYLGGEAWKRRLQLFGKLGKALP